jgi:hypothetical protein
LQLPKQALDIRDYMGRTNIARSKLGLPAGISASAFTPAV